MVNMEFGKRVKSLRLSKKLTQEQLANRLGVTKSVVSAYETGLRMPSYDILIAIARMFSVTTDLLLGVQIKNDIDLSGLTNEEIAAVRNLVKVMKKG